MKIVIAGGSGFLGRSLASFLETRGHRSVVLTRQPRGEGDVQWDGLTTGPWIREFEDAAAIVNLAGRSINCIHDASNRREILDSRIGSVRAVQSAIEQCLNPPEVVVQASAVAIYGDTVQLCDENAPGGEGFLCRVCQAWEGEFFNHPTPRTRKCALRIGFVVGPDGGGLAPLRTLAKWFLGGTVGQGGQYISWIHVDDLNRMILACVENRSMSGVYNATSPKPVTNREFMRTLRRVLGRPWSPPVPGFMVKLGARLILHTDAGVALTGQNCIPGRFLQAGYKFTFPNLEEALRAAMEQWGREPGKRDCARAGA